MPIPALEAGVDEDVVAGGVWVPVGGGGPVVLEGLRTLFLISIDLYF
jgi:hypothetical protein